MFTRGCFDLFVHFWSSIVKWIIAADGCLSCRNLASVPGNISSWSPSFVALPFLHLKALKWKAICQIQRSGFNAAVGMLEMLVSEKQRLTG